MANMTLILSSSQVRSLLSMSDCISAVEEAFREFASGTTTMPTRVGVQLTEKAGWLGIMPAYLSRMESLSTKIVSVYTQNQTARGIPNVQAVIILNDAQNGRVAAILEGSYITAMRTGAVSGVATKYLARQESEVVGVVGAGVQARKQLEAICAVRKVRRAVVYDVDKKRASNFVTEMSAQLGINISIADTPSELSKASDIIATATTSSSPVLNGRDIKPGTHINAIGAFTPTTRELDDDVVASSKIVVDSLEAALAEAGDIIIPLKNGVIQREQIWAELGELVLGKKPGRESSEERTLFKSVGLGIQDAAVAKLVFSRAQSLGVGAQFDLEG
jgi:ornithine cyclodeaminase/alanine dehydrogenase